MTRSIRIELLMDWSSDLRTTQFATRFRFSEVVLNLQFNMNMMYYETG